MAVRWILPFAATGLAAPEFVNGAWATETLSSWANTIPGWSDPSPLMHQFEYVPLLEFYEHNYRELVADDLPVKACTSQRKPAQFWRLPFVRSRLRLTPDGWPEPNIFGVLPTMTLHQTLPQRGFCKWLGALEIPYVSWMVTSSWFCEDCSHRPCAKAVGFVPGTHELTADLPPGGDACVWIDKLPDGARKMRVTWGQPADPRIVGLLLIGAMLVWNCTSLRESTLLHAAMGGAGSLGVLVIMASLWFYSSARSAINGNIPLGGLLTSLGMMMCVLVPSVGQALVSIVTPSSASDVWAWLNFSVYNVPAGWIVAVSSVAIILKTISIGARWSVMYFASPPEPEGDVPFDIGRDGRRIDLGLPSTPLPQRCLGILIWLCGLVILLQSTYSDGCSLALTVFVLFKDSIFNVLGQGWCRLRGTDQFASYELHRHVISMEAYETEGKKHTVAALAQLRRYIRGEGLYAFAGEEAELRMRRFCDGHERLAGTRQPETDNINKILDRERRLSSVPSPYSDHFDLDEQPTRRCSIL